MTKALRSIGLILATVLPVQPLAAQSAMDHEHAARDHVLVRISSAGLEPSPRLATPNDAIVWLNYARFPVRVSLEANATARIHCREPSHFALAADGSMRADWVEPLGAASLCLLAPGRYDYLVEELDGAARPPSPLPGGHRFEGRLIVTAMPTAEQADGSRWRLASHHRAVAGMETEIAAARDRLADLLDADGQRDAAARARERARQARVAAAAHTAEAKAIERTLEGIERTLEGP